MIVEFIGAPGAGKTTLLPVVREYLAERGIDARTVVDAARPYAQRTLLGKAVGLLVPNSLRRPLLWQVFYYFSLVYRLRFLVRHPRLIGLVLSSQRRRPVSADVRGRRVLYWFFHLAGYYEFLTAHARPGEALVLDEGFIHRVVQLNASDAEAPDPTTIMDYVNLLPPPDLIIVPRAPLEVCEKRIGNRGIWKHFSHKSPAEISRYLANSHFIVNVTVDYIKSKEWPVVEVDNGSDDLTAAAAELRGKLAGLPAFARAQPHLQEGVKP